MSHTGPILTINRRWWKLTRSILCLSCHPKGFNFNQSKRIFLNMNLSTEQWPNAWTFARPRFPQSEPREIFNSSAGKLCVQACVCVTMRAVSPLYLMHSSYAGEALWGRIVELPLMLKNTGGGATPPSDSCSYVSLDWGHRALRWYVVSICQKRRKTNSRPGWRREV